MFFTLEALRARHGDCLMLHAGTPDRPELVLIDGGWFKVYRTFLEPRLEELRARRAPGGELEIDLLMVSHIDEDHIQGVLDLTKELRKKKERGEARPWMIREMWHNSFDDIVEEDRAEDVAATAELEVGVAGLGEGETVPREILDRHQGAIVLASVRQGRQLRLDAEFLTIPLNPTDSGNPLVLEGEERELDSGVVLRVLGPSEEQVEELRKEWDEFLVDAGLAQDPVKVAEFVDKSVFNLSSIVVLAEAKDDDGKLRRMLLTGDARGDFLRDAIERAGLFDDDGRFHVDVFKIPHHGSHHNVELETFRRITADHYVVSGDGNYGNPELDTFRMILEARGNAPYHLHLTYPVDELEDPKKPFPKDELRELLDDAQAANPDLRIHAIPAGERSLKIDLLDRFPD